MPMGARKISRKSIVKFEVNPKMQLLGRGSSSAAMVDAMIDSMVHVNG